MGSVSSGVSLVDFIAYEIPTKKWMKRVCPKIRLRVRAQNREFVSPVIKLSGQSSNAQTVSWPWADDVCERFSRPYIADDEPFEVEIERRFLFRYKCIRRTKKLVSLDQFRTDNHCALSLYAGQQPEAFDNSIVMGEITFTLLDSKSSLESRSQR